MHLQTRQNQRSRFTGNDVGKSICVSFGFHELDLIDDASGILVKQIKPNFKTLGPKFGKDMKAIAQAVAGLQQEDIRKIEQEGEISLALENKTIILQLIKIKPIPYIYKSLTTISIS